MLPPIPSSFNFTKTGKPLKEVDPNVIVTWGKFNAKCTVWLLALKGELAAHEGWAFKLTNSFFGSDLMDYAENRTKVTLYAPVLNTGHDWPMLVNMDKGYFKVTAKKGLLDPLGLVRTDIITANSFYHTWPDEKGRFKIFMHKATRVARLRYKAAPVKTFINREALKYAKRWDILEKYIQGVRSAGGEPIRKDICDLVRTVSEYEIEHKQEQELKRVLEI